MRLKDKVAIVTGSGRGIGKDIALAYAREGAHVVINDLDPATAGSTAAEAAELGVRSLPLAADVARKPDGERIVDATMREFGRIDILVPNHNHRRAWRRQRTLPRGQKIQARTNAWAMDDRGQKS